MARQKHFRVTTKAESRTYGEKVGWFIVVHHGPVGVVLPVAIRNKKRAKRIASIIYRCLEKDQAIHRAAQLKDIERFKRERN